MIQALARVALPAAAAGGVLLALTGCTHASYDCSDGTCAVYLEGVGASIDIDAHSMLGPGASGEVTVELTDLADDSATFTVNGADATCSPGQSLTVSDLQVTCREINEEGMSMEISS